MARIDLDVVGKDKQLVMDAVVKTSRIFACVSRQVRPAYGSNEKRVACEYEPRIGAAFEVGDEQADALGRMAGCV
jgi:hypothetical protein